MNSEEIGRKKLYIAKHGVWAVTRAGERIKVLEQDGKLFGALYCHMHAKCSPFTEWDLDGKNELARCDDLISIDGVATSAARSPCPA